MEHYRILYRIKVEHGYFDGLPCTALQCRLAPQGEALARRRGLLFRQTAPDEWTLLFRQEPDTAADVLMLDLSVADPKFALYTAWEGFRPSASYRLELPQAEERVDAATAIRPSDKKRTFGSGFCTVSLRLSDETVKAAESGEPKCTLLHFREAFAQWEYLFIPHDGAAIPPEALQLEDTTGKIRFTEFRECEAYGRKAWSTRSTTHIPMCRNYPVRLRLTAQYGGRHRRILLSHVAPPEPGRYQDVPAGILRQICYC